MPTTLPIPPRPTSTTPAPPRRDGGRWRRHAIRVALALLWLAVVVAAAFAGLELRDWVWRETQPIRFRFDVTNAMRLGHGVNDDAVALARARNVAFEVAGGDLVGAVSRVAAARQRAPLRGQSDAPAVASWADTWAAYVRQYDRAFDAVAPSRQDDLPGAPVPDNAYFFDYPPGRLWVVTAWVREVRADPTIDSRENPSRRSYSDDAVAPMRRVNEWHEAFAAAGIFALARRVLRRAGRTNVRATTLATVAALLAWFNPALLLNAHGWPQWDCWVLPYVIWATYFGVSDRWLMAGALVAVGAMFKGQVLLVAPLLAMWPLLRLDVDAVARLAAGFVFAAAACLSPWLLRTTPAIAWLAGVAAFAVLLAMTSTRRKSRPRGAIAPQSRGFAPRALLDVRTRGFPSDDRPSMTPSTSKLQSKSRSRDPRTGWFVALVVAAIAWIVAPFAVPGAPISAATMLLLAGFTVGVPAVWRGRAMPIVLATVGLGAFAAAARFDGSFAWLPVGFQTGRYLSMALGRVANLPTVLAADYDWQIDSPVTLFGTTLDARTLLRGLFAAGLVLIAAGMARATRRGRPALGAMRAVGANLLVALPAAWTLAYAVLPQMHERYLLWGAVTSALLAARSVGGLLAHAFLTGVQVAMILLSMIDSKRMAEVPPWREWRLVIRGLHPHVGYAVALMACVLIVWSLTRDERSRRVS